MRYRRLVWLVGLLWLLVSGLTVAQTSVLYERRITYQDYLAEYQGAPRPQVEIVIPAVAFRAAANRFQILTNYEGYDGRVLWTDERGYIEWEVDVPQAGLYNLEITYYPAEGRGTTIEREIQINGESLFEGADYLRFHRIFGDAGPSLFDAVGNEIRPRQIEKPQWRTVYLTDTLGYELKPYQFYFKEGKNTIRLVSLAEPLVIAELRLCQAEEPLPYDEAMAGVSSSQVPKGDVFIKIQAEDSTVRSSPSLFAVHDQGDPTTEPYDPAKIRLNSIGGHRWQETGDWIAWEFEVPEDGYYEIAFKAKQNLNRGVFSNRRIMIDGRVPYAELEAVPFNFSARYELKRLGEDTHDSPFLFYLTKGKHELLMEAVLGEWGPLISMTEASLYELNTLYRSIIMITSVNPDPMRSYQLEQRVPDLLARLGQQATELRKIASELERITGDRGGQTATLLDIARMLDRMVKRPDSIPNLLQEYRDAIGNLGTWIMNARKQPLQIDYIIVASPGQAMPRVQPRFWEVALHELRAFIASFTHDYTSIHSVSELEDTRQTTDENTIKVWIGLGRDQAQILKQMIEDTFTPETGIRVDLELVTAMEQLLVPSTIAGTNPDVAIGAANMDLAFRGAVVDLTQFPDFPEVAQRFKKSALLAFRFRDKVFALPEMQSFPMLFYRKDILSELGLDVPQTWDDVYRILPELQNHHLEFGIYPSIYTYIQFLYQKGVALYQEDVIAANLEAEAAIATFEEMTNLYTQSGLPLQYNFINRFRMGEMPIAIANYGEYNTLTIFAPELRGQWGMAPIPGVRQPDGTINRTVPVAQDALVIRTDGTGTVMMPSGTTGSIILAKSTKQDKAWEFLKWWTRTDTQVRFGRELEALIGPAARYATANVEAMQQLPWRVEEREQLMLQWDWVEGIPPVLGGYYVTRQFDWLFRAVVLHNEPIRESVLDYSREINREMARKRAEFELETDLEDLDDKWKELYWDHYTHVYRLDWEPQEIDPEYRAILERLGLLLEEEGA